MDQKYGEFIGVDSVYCALVTIDSDDAYTVGAPFYLAPVADVAGEPEINNKTTYYDNKAANNYVTEGKTDLKITSANIPADIMATILGKHYDAASGRVIDTGDANPPDVALGFRFSMGKNGYRYYWFLKGTFSGGTEEAATQSNDVDVKNYPLTFTAVNTTKKWTVGGEEKSVKRIFGDTADAAFDPTGWFGQVQTPDTSGSPSALALSSSLPADGATGVAVDANLTLTFNNAIDAYAVTLINATTLAVIANAQSLDATKKILTINPSENLSASTDYAIIASRVTDVFGQHLDNTIIDFTTA